VAIGSAAARVGTLLALQRPAAPPFGPAEDRLLAAAAAQIALAVDRARLRDEATENDVLRRSDELKTSLLGAVSHELRTPLASMMASAGSLLQKDVEWTDAEREEFLQAILEEVVRLDRLVGELLDVSRIEAGRLVVDKQWHSVDELVRDTLGRMRSTTARHRVRLDIPDDLPPAPLDDVAVGQVLRNLIENASRYAPAGTAISISARIDGEELRLKVADEGPGVAPEDRERAFAPFERLRRAERRTDRGVGLGLAIARRLVEAHGGRVWVESAEGGGARFVVALPLAIEPTPA
ncbi:MAG: ATP-binding protein, partial [Chloroflexota bacterium]|nr:ATP-binding protein [Chloroflexota bacterium]